MLTPLSLTIEFSHLLCSLLLRFTSHLHSTTRQSQLLLQCKMKLEMKIGVWRQLCRDSRAQSVSDMMAALESDLRQKLTLVCMHLHLPSLLHFFFFIYCFVRTLFTSAFRLLSTAPHTTLSLSPLSSFFILSFLSFHHSTHYTPNYPLPSLHSPSLLFSSLLSSSASLSCQNRRRSH